MKAIILAMTVGLTQAPCQAASNTLKTLSADGYKSMLLSSDATQQTFAAAFTMGVLELAKDTLICLQPETTSADIFKAVKLGFQAIHFPSSKPASFFIVGTLAAVYPCPDTLRLTDYFKQFNSHP